MERRTVSLALGALMAVCSGTCAPAPGGTLGDVVYPRERGEMKEIPPAYFPHWVHRIRYKCYACHDDLFAMKRGGTPTMAEMSQGKSCGACHEGKTAFALDTCQRCHVAQ